MDKLKIEFELIGDEPSGGGEGASFGASEIEGAGVVIDGELADEGEIVGCVSEEIGERLLFVHVGILPKRIGMSTKKISKKKKDLRLTIPSAWDKWAVYDSDKNRTNWRADARSISNEHHDEPAGGGGREIGALGKEVPAVRWGRQGVSGTERGVQFTAATLALVPCLCRHGESGDGAGKLAGSGEERGNVGGLEERAERGRVLPMQFYGGRSVKKSD